MVCAGVSYSDSLAYTKQPLLAARKPDPARQEVTTMSNFITFNAASGVAAAFAAVRTAPACLNQPAPIHTTRMSVVGLTDVFGLGYPPRGIPL